MIAWGNMKVVIQHSELQFLSHFPDDFGQDHSRFRKHINNIFKYAIFNYKIIDSYCFWDLRGKPDLQLLTYVITKLK